MSEATTTVELDGQYRALREGAGFVDRSERGKLRVSGADAVDYLQGQITNDVEALAPNRGCYAALLDRKGHMRADMRVLRLEAGEIWLDTEACVTEVVLEDLNLYRIGREVALEDVTDAWAITSVIGPAAAELAGTEPLSPEHAQRHFVRDEVEILAVATDLGLDLITRAEGADALRELLAAAGAPRVSEEAAEILRIESGRPRFGYEMDERTIPQEADINERAVDFQKGCYIGQETVARLHYKGKPNRHLRGLRLEAAAAPGDVLRLGEREVGRIGSACISPALGPIALAIVRREAAPGDTVAVGESATPAQIVELPFGG